MKVSTSVCWGVSMSTLCLYLMSIILLSIQNSPTSQLGILFYPIKDIQIYNQDSFCTPVTQTKSDVKFYQISSTRLYHYEYRYELNKQNSSSDESRLIILLTGRGRTCLDWWKLSTGESILSQMRSSGFSILAICTSRKDYQISMPIQKNLDVYWIYTTLQMWIKDIYFQHFQHYPRLYLFGVSQGSRIASLLARVLPIQAQILTIYPGERFSMLNRSDYDRNMQNRLIADYTFANWFYLDYCSKPNTTKNTNCLLHSLNKNYLNPLPPTYFIHQQRDVRLKLSDYQRIIADIRKDALHLGGLLLTRHESVKLSVAQPATVTPDYMKENFNKWFCKPTSSRLFYEHFTNPKYNTPKRSLKTCWCTPTNFLYFKQHPNIINTWSKTKQEEYRDYVQDIQRFRLDFCETVCGDLLTKHTMSSHHINETLKWLNEVDHYRSLYKIQDFLSRPLRLWMYDKSTLVDNATYLTYQTPFKSSCGRNYAPQQMYSPEYFLQDYFRRLNKSYPLSRHNFQWTKNPLLADYYIIPHDYICMYFDYYQITLTDLEFKSFCTHLNKDYFIPLITNVRTLFPYWNMSSGSNHIMAFTIGKNMAMVRNRDTEDSLKHVIQLAFTGFREDLLSPNASPLYVHRNFTPYYRHNYDIVIPAFNRIQSLANRSRTLQSDLDRWYNNKRNLFFFAGLINKSSARQSVRQRLLLFIKENIGEGKRYQNMTTIDGKQLKTITFIDEYMTPADYAESISSTIFHLCPEGYSPWSPRLYESIGLGAIPLILAESIVLPFERFIDWRSFSVKINPQNIANIIDLILNRSHFDDYVKEKIKYARQYFNAFRWPYSPVNDDHQQHLFLPEADIGRNVKNVFHYLSLELRCRRLEQLYGLTFDRFSRKSINATRQACQKHSTICPCDDERTFDVQ